MIPLLRAGLKGALRACRTREEMAEVWKESPTWRAELKRLAPEEYAALEAWAKREAEGK